MTPRRPPTPFEEQVYAIVRRIPRGAVRSYRWVAEQLGDPRLARAVGNALNRNPWPFPKNVRTSARQHVRTRVPCHRVIRSDGTLGGYAKGSTRKRALLRREKVRYT
ncbi:MAG: MGMT family protein [Candidatus Omnitrophica bacterium]|nr:MGMT family protein [Candidatus Omnitrophota bacterium]